MIVENKEETLNKANKISSKIIRFISNEFEKEEVTADPAENAYLSCHIIGILLAKTCVSLEGYGETYGIPNFNIDLIKGWINEIAKENLEHYIR